MTRALVTGGCGFLGSWIVRQLVERGETVRVLAIAGESRENIADLDVEVVEGDVRSRSSVEEVVSGCEVVFHAAAIYDDFAPDPSVMYDVNMRGTFNVMEASRRASVDRVIYTASIVSLGRPQLGGTADESAPYECWDLDFAYSRSKFHSREIAEYFADWGMDVRVVCPGVVLGPGDLRPTPSGQLIVSAFTKGMPALHFDGGASYVDVRDAARVHLLADERGRAGERYIATVANLTNEDLVRVIQSAAGTDKTMIKLPVSVARSVAIGMNRFARRTGNATVVVARVLRVLPAPVVLPKRKSETRARRDVSPDRRDGA